MKDFQEQKAITALTCAQVAERLGLHVRTVRRHVREGRLESVRLGKSYRIPPRALEPFLAGPSSSVTPTPAPTEEPGPVWIDVSTIIEIEPANRTSSDRITRTLHAAANGHRRDNGPLRIDTQYAPQRSRLKIIVSGSPAATSAILDLVATLAET